MQPGRTDTLLITIYHGMSGKELKAVTWRQELKQSPWRKPMLLTCLHQRNIEPPFLHSEGIIAGMTLPTLTWPFPIKLAT